MLTHRLAAVLIAFVCQLASASPLSGQFLGSESSYNVGIFPPSAIVGRGEEFIDLFGNLAFDFDEFGYVTVSLEFGTRRYDNSAEYVEFFDQNGTIEEIVGFRLISVDLGKWSNKVEQSDLSFTANSIRFAIGDTRWEGENASVSMKVVFASSVPEPNPPAPSPKPKPVPKPPAIDADLYLINRAGEVFIINSSTMTRRNSGDLHSVGPDIALDASASTIYQATRSAQGLSGYSTSDFRLVSNLQLTGFPADGDSTHDTLSALEFAGKTLYGASAIQGGGFETSDSALLKIDLSSGALATVGFSGLPSWTTGMAYDPTEAVMYGVTGAHSGRSQFFRVNLATGNVTNILPVTLNGEQIDAVTGLTFGEDGQLYVVLQTGSIDTPDTNLFVIDRATGSLSDLGDTGMDPVAVSRATKELPSGNPATGPMSANVEEVKAIARLYSAAFDRYPKVSGLNFWVDAYESGKSLQEIAKKFNESPEFTKNYGPLSNRQFIVELFQNVLGRGGDPSGIGFWESHLDNGLSRAIVLAKFAESKENAAKTSTLLSEMRFEGGLWVF